MAKNKPSRPFVSGTALGSALVSAMALSHASAVQAQDAVDNGNVVVYGADASPLKAQDNTAMKMDVSLKNTGRSVVQLNADQLEDRGIENIRQAFDYVAGFRGNGAADRTYTARGVRTPIDNVMVDGLRSLQGGEGGTGSRLPSTFNAESTTFLRGPAGLLYGPGVGGGLVNITTKKPQEEAETTIGFSNRSYLSDDTGYFDRNSTSLNLDSTGRVGSSEVLYRVLADYTPSGDQFQEGRDTDEKLLDAALSFKVGEHTVITPRYELAERNRTGGSSYADGVFESNFASGSVTTYGQPINRGKYYGSPNDKGDNKTDSFSVRIDHALNDQWKLTAQGRKSDTQSESLDLYISDSRGLQNELGRDAVNRKWVYAKGDDEYSLFDLSTQGKFSLGNTDHHLVFGANYRDMDVGFARKFQSNDSAVGVNTISASNPDNQMVGPVPADLINVTLTPRNQKDTNIYLKDRISFGDITVVGGLSYVKQEQTGNIKDSAFSNDYSDTVWDLGAIYALTPDVNVFATYSRAYAPVSARYIAQYGQGKTDYAPVEGNNYEVGLKGDFIDGKLSTAVTLFRLDRENNTSWVRNDQGWLLQQNSGIGFQSSGVEIDAHIEWTPQLSTSLSYAYTRAFDRNDNRRQANNTPKNSIAAWTNYRLNGDLSPVRLGLGVRHEGKRFDGSNIIKPYTEFDLGAYYETPDWDVSLVLRNAFDKNRAEAGANWVTVQPNEPRSLNLSFKYRL